MPVDIKSPSTASFTLQIYFFWTIGVVIVSRDESLHIDIPLRLTFSLTCLHVDYFLYLLSSKYCALMLLLGVPQSLIIWFSTTALICEQSHSSHLSIFTSPSNEDQPLLPYSSSLITTYFIPASLFTYLLQYEFWSSSSFVPLHQPSLQPFQPGSTPGSASTCQQTSLLQSHSPSTTATFHASVFLQHSWYPCRQTDLFYAFESALGICASPTFWAKGLSVCLASPNGFSTCRFI